MGEERWAGLGDDDFLCVEISIVGGMDWIVYATLSGLYACLI